MKALARDFYRLFFLEANTGIWVAELKRPMPVRLSDREQYLFLSRHTVLAGCNRSFALMCGYRSPRQLLGVPLPQVFYHPEMSGENLLLQCIKGNFDIRGVVTCEITPDGDSAYFENSCIGIFEKGRLTRLWGFRRLVTVEHRKQIERRKLLDKLTANQRLILEMTVRGSALKEIAAARSLSINTIACYRIRALRKLNIRSVSELIRQAAVLGLDTHPHGEVHNDGRIDETVLSL